MTLRGRIAAGGATLSVMALAAPAGSADVQTAGRACGPAGAKTIVSSRVARVYSRPGTKRLLIDRPSGPRRPWPVERFFGCLRATGRSYVLSWRRRGAEDDHGEWREPSAFRLAGRYVAFLEAKGIGAGPADDSVARRNLATGRLRRERDVAALETEPEDSFFHDLDWQPMDLVLRATGAFAWTAAHAGGGNRCDDPAQPWTCRVFKVGRRDRALLDEGTGIEPVSLRLRRAIVSWLKDGRRQSATLR